MPSKIKALFLDRDGIINEDRKYPYRPQDIVFIPAVFNVCKAALEKGYILVVTTNQAGIAKGYYTEKDVQELHVWMTAKFREKGIEITKFYYCPFHKDGVVERYKKDSDLRKPKPGMYFEAARELNIDLSSSIMVGDKQSDRIELPGLKCYIIKSQYSPDNFDFESLDQVITIL